MNAIVAIKSGDRVFLGRDTMTTDDTTITYADDKVYKTAHRGWVVRIGTAGDVGILSRFRLRLFENLLEQSSGATPEHAVYSLANHLRIAAKGSPDGNTAGCVVVIARNIFVIDSTGAVVGPCDSASNGVGGAPALAALAVLTRYEGEVTASLVKQAIAEAAKVVPGVGGEIIVEEL